MRADKVKELIAAGEGPTVEFKSIESGQLGNSVFETVSSLSYPRLHSHHWGHWGHYWGNFEGSVFQETPFLCCRRGRS